MRFGLVDCETGVRSLWVVLVVLVVVLVVLLSWANVHGQESEPDNVTAAEKLRAEFQNLRELPFGFTAQCIDDDLKFKSASSATFVIRQSLLCAEKALTIPLQRRSKFILCSNDPHRRQNSNFVVPKCNELKLLTDSV